MIDDFFHPVPFYRSILFHLGFFPLVILLWAWADSVGSHLSWMRQVGPRAQYVAINADSKLVFRRSLVTVEDSRADLSQYFHPTGTLGWVRRQEIPVGFQEPWFPPAEIIAETRPVPYLTFHNSGISLPYWLVLTCYIPLWVAASFWHSRRKTKRLQQSLPSAQPQTD